MVRKLLRLSDEISKLKEDDVNNLNNYLKILDFDYKFEKLDSAKPRKKKEEKVPKNLLQYADKIANMKQGNIDKINGYLKALESIYRIGLTDGEQMKRAGKSMKDGLNKIIKGFENL